MQLNFPLHLKGKYLFKLFLISPNTPASLITQKKGENSFADFLNSKKEKNGLNE